MEKKVKKQTAQENMRVDMEQMETEEDLSQVTGGQFRGCDEKGVGYLPGRPILAADKK